MNSILLSTIQGSPSNRPPFWFMRQAGRVLPSYMSIKKTHTFWEIMKNPQLGAKVTLLPIDDLGVDAAILFSDILVIPYAMGMGLDFTDKGPVFDTPLTKVEKPLELLDINPNRLDYIYDVIDVVMQNKPSHIPLIGFCGGPLTVLCYLLQGLGKNPEFPDAIRYIYQNKKTVQRLTEMITELSILYAREQIKHGVSVFQLFETHAGIIPFTLYKELFLPSIQAMADAVRAEHTPFIFFPKGVGAGVTYIKPDMCDYLSIDWQMPMEWARENVHPDIHLQGNLDPRLLFAPESDIKSALDNYIEFWSRNQRSIFNLGHGFLPTIPFEKARFVANYINSVNLSAS